MKESVQKKLDNLKEIIAGYGQVGVAFSGGVDSTLVLKISTDIHGEKAVGLFCNSALQTLSVVDDATVIAQQIGARLITVNSDILSDPLFLLNEEKRCYHCKKKTYQLFLEKLKGLGIDSLLDGTNCDDDDQYRPGSQAIKELGVKTPLRQAGLTKKEIRLISREYGLPTWDKFSASCLATRVQTDQPITEEKLRIIEHGENILLDHNFKGCRMRHCGTYAVVQLTMGDHHRFISGEILPEIKKYLKSEGVVKVFLDLSGREGILT